jgi:hypothetical protein
MSDVMNKEDTPENATLWTREQEELLKDWCDIANCFRWMHEESSLKYRKLNNKIALPVIVLSTLTGTANFAMKSFVPESSQQYALAVVGAINIFCGVLTTVQTYFKYAELTEGHMSASKMWSKFQRTVGIELAIDRTKRRHPNQFLKYCIDEYNKLKETSPAIPKSIAMEFKTKFKHVKNVYKPDVYDNIGNTLTYLDYMNRNEQLVSPTELQTIHIDSDVGSMLKSRPSMFNHPPVKELARNFVGEQINHDIRKSLNDADYIHKATLNHKEEINKELRSLKPNIKGLIHKIQNTTGESTIDLTTNSHNIDINLIKNI